MAFRTQMGVLMLWAVICRITAAQDSPGFLQKTDIREVQSHEAKAAVVDDKSNMLSDTNADLDHEVKKSKQPSVDEDAPKSTLGSIVTRIVLQLVFGLLYYMVIVSKYPAIPPEPNAAAKKLQAVDEVFALTEDAQSLDLMTGAKTGFCGVYESRDL